MKRLLGFLLSGIFGLVVGVNAFAYLDDKPSYSSETDKLLSDAKEAQLKGDFAKATELLGTYLKAKPDSAEGHFLAARAARRAGRAKEAQNHLKRCEELKVEPAKIEFERLLAEVQEGDANHDAILKIEKLDLGKDNPETPLVLEALAQGCIQELRDTSALEHLNRWLQLETNSIPALLLRAKVELSLEVTEKSSEDYRKVLKLDPKNREAQQQLAESLLESSAVDESLKLFEQLVESDKSNLPALLGKARCCHQLGRVDEATKLAEKALEKDPKSLVALRLKGILALAAGQAVDAEKWLKKALAADPDDQQTHSDLHTCLRMLNKEAEAEVHLEKMKERDADIERFNKALLAFIQKPTEDVALRTEFAGLCLRLGHTEIGLRHLKRCVKLDPTYRPAHKKLAEYYEKVGDKDTALTHKKLGEAEK